MKEPLLAHDGEQLPLPQVACDRPRSWPRLRGGSEEGKLGQLAVYCVVLVFGSIVAAVAFSRNAGCSYDALRNVSPPYGGNLIPDNAILIERKSWLQLSKRVDVFTPEKKHIGYFYDMNFMFFMRFGFSDASGRIWFEAKYPSFFSRFQLGSHYYLERCDVGVGGRLGAVYEVQEDWHKRPWFCWQSCSSQFYISRKPDAAGDDPQAAPLKVAKVKFASQLYRSGLSSRHAWYMSMIDTQAGSEMAYAQQHFFYGGALGLNLLSNWTVDVKQENPSVPNWVIAFMATLDDIKEDPQ